MHAKHAIGSTPIDAFLAGAFFWPRRVRLRLCATHQIFLRTHSLSLCPTDLLIAKTLSSSTKIPEESIHGHF